MKQILEPLDIYWAPYWMQTEVTKDLSHLFPSPKTLYEECLEKQIENPERSNFINCPAVSEKMKHTYVFRTIQETKVSLNGSDVAYEQNLRYPALVEHLHGPTMENNEHLNYHHCLLFFSSESVIASMTAPYFELPTSHKYGMIVPGEYDIGQWYRPMNIEFNLWSGVTSLHVNAGDALCYIQFHTDRPVRLHRYHVTEELSTLAMSLVHISPLRFLARLTEKYKMFNNAQLRTRVLREIKKNIEE